MNGFSSIKPCRVQLLSGYIINVFTRFVKSAPTLKAFSTVVFSILFPYYNYMKNLLIFR